MPRYSSYGSLDDRVQEDGDRSFSGFNNRLRPDQLEAGILADSQNGRMGTNGQWQVRKGVDTLLSPVAVGGQTLSLPFFLQDTDKTTGTVQLDTPSSGNIQINFSAGHGYTTAATGKVRLTGLTGIAPAVSDGMVDITVVDSDSIKITDQTYTAAPSGTVTLTKPQLADD